MPDRLPEHIELRTAHAFQGALDEMDAGLSLCWNTRLDRFEIWRHWWSDLDPLHIRPVWGFVIRITGPDGTGFAHPGAFAIQLLRERDARHNSLEAIVKTYARELNASQEAWAASEQAKADDKVHEANERAPLIARALLDDPTIGKPYPVAKPKEDEHGRGQPATEAS